MAGDPAPVVGLRSVPGARAVRESAVGPELGSQRSACAISRMVGWTWLFAKFDPGPVTRYGPVK